MDAFIQDIRTACRSLRRSPGFAAVALLTLAVAVGANAAILSIADAVLFRPLPYSDPDRLFVLQMLNPATGGRFASVPFEHLHAINEQHAGLSNVVVNGGGPRIVETADGVTTPVRTIAVTTNYFEVLGVQAARGRLFNRGDAQNSRAGVLSHTAWVRRFGADPNIVGRSVRLGGFSFDVVGVLPRNFLFPTHQIFSLVPELITIAPPMPTGKAGAFHPVVRLESGISREQAQAELDAIIARLTPESAESTTRPVLDEIRPAIFRGGHSTMWFLFAGALTLLLIGCANLANMLVVRNHRRGHELGVRAALGAATGRLIRPLVFESLFIGLAGGAVALFITSSTFDLLAAEVPNVLYRSVSVGVDLRIVGLALGLSVVASLVFSVFPAWRSAAFDVRTRIHGTRIDGSIARRTLGRPMVAAQVALTIVLVFGAATAARAFISLVRMELGFNPENVLTISIWPPKGTVDRQGFYVRALDSIGRRSDVVSVGAVGSIPLGGSMPDDGVMSPGARQPQAGISHVLPGYFETAGIPLIRGRLLNRNDLDAADTAVVSESAARQLFPGVEPLGATFANSGGRTFTVVGVVADVRRSLTPDSPSQAYVIPGASARGLFIIARVRDRRQEMLAQIRRELAPLVAEEPVTTAWWSDSITSQSGYRNPRFQALVLVTIGALALGLTGLGVFGVISFLITMRTREMSIRIAMGASPSSLVSFVLRQAMSPVAIGVALGLVVTQWAKRLAETQLFKVDTEDPVMLAASVATVLLAATAAAYLPARRASRIDPIQVLRAE
jgi:putative ABC transport system permease protein